MTSAVALTGFRIGPLYFFDQPTKRNRIKGTRSSILHFNLPNEGAQSEDTTQSIGENDNPEGTRDELTPRLPGETCGDVKPDTSSAVGAALNIKDHDPVEAYKRAAPQLLNEVARLLSQHKWTEEGRIPHGIVNILNYSWRDLAAGSVHLKSQEEAGTRRKTPRGSVNLDEGSSRQVSPKDKREAEERNSCVVGNAGPSVRKPQVSSNPRVKKRKHSSNRAQNSTTGSFSMSSNSCSNPGWIIQPKQPSCDEPQQISLCQWVVKRLQAARSPEKLQTTVQDLSKPLLLRHYGDAKAKLKDRRARRRAQPVTLVNGMPRIPEVEQQDPERQKLHYRMKDGSSFIYYPSGCIAVCASHSGLPCGGLYTNVFSDGECPVILATITASGHGAVTHPLSSTITAVWDQAGGFLCDHHGNITKEWSWQTDRTLRENIVIQLSDVISVRLLSGTSAMLSFRCNNESVQLPFLALTNINQSQETTCLQTEAKFTSDSAQDLLLRKSKSSAVVLESKRNLFLTPVSVCSREVLQMVREVEGLEEPSAQWRRRGHVGRELKMLQQRVRSILDGWLDYYQVAIGIKCPDTERMSVAPLRTRLRREVLSAALPSLHPPERADAEPVRPERGRNELRELHRHPSTVEGPRDSYVKLPRTSKKQTKEELRVTRIGPLQIYGNIKLESVILQNSADLQPSAVTRCAAPPSVTPTTPSTPLTACPALLRAALLGEGGRRRCCCSAKLMPVITDLEYDAFIMGQPPHSQQILVVCVTPPLRPVNTRTVSDQDVLEQLYRRRNKHRSMPCTQCQMDSFRLVRYEMSTGEPSCGGENMLLQQRHNAAPGMVLMYIRGKLLFVGHIFSGHSCSVRDLQKQISRTRGDYRLGLSLSSDYKYSDTVNKPAATDANNSQDATLKKGDDTTRTASVEKEKTNERNNYQLPGVSRQRRRDFCIKPHKTPALTSAVITH